ncbi:MAG: aminopeptidase P family protein [Pseudomonadota bacterium]
MFQSFDITADSRDSASRTAALRTAMAAEGVQAFIVPRSDAHMGETVPPSDERLAWLTGFTGSAGTAVITTERAALFVDGRYTLQAAEQADTAVFEIVASQTTAPGAWLAEALGEGVLGYDPWLHAPAEIERLTKALGREPVALGRNPIDALWHDRPPRPAGAAAAHPSTLTGEAAGDKRARLGDGLAKAGADASVLTLPESIAWLLNIRGTDLARSPVVLGFAILRADGQVTLFTEPEKVDGALAAHLGNGVAVAPPDQFEPALRALGESRVLVDRASCPMAVIAALKAGGSKVELGEDPCILPKARKTEAELEGMRAAHRRDGAAVCRFLARLDADLARGGTVTEIDVARRIEAERVATGALMDLSFDTIAGSGPNGAIVHYRVTKASNRTVVPGDVLLVDSGGQYRDGTTDITRTLATGETPADARRAFTLVLKGMIALSTARWPAGLAGRDLDPLARAALWRAGLDYDHGTGHGVGAFLNVHEGPVGLSRRSGTVALAPGMVLSNEPGCYRTGHWGIRIENLLAVTPPDTPAGGDRAMLGFETLTLAPIDRRLIDRALLDPGEVAWLDAYHARVAAEIGPLVAEDAEVAAWLADACAPLG